jgi:hypothetical protein
MRKSIVPMILAASLMAAQACAETVAASGGFTIKRLLPPAKGTTQRITVQIDPDFVPPPPPVLKTYHHEEGELMVPSPSESPEGATTTAFDWYWQAVTPSMIGAGPGHFQVALSALSAGPNGETVAAPRLQTLQNIAQTHGSTILQATIGTKVSPALVLAVIGIESGGQSDAESHAGAQGLMQLMPGTAERFGVTDATNAEQNIKGGVAYLEILLKQFNNDPVLALAGYNAGENAVLKYQGVPPYAETRGYVPKVLAAWQVAKGLCLTPPELANDGCVFAVSQQDTNG